MELCDFERRISHDFERTLQKRKNDGNRGCCDVKIVAVVPIKLNNERLPGKNTKKLGDKALIHYCLEELLNVNEIHEIYVYCSDESIKEYLPVGVRFLKRHTSLDLPTSNFTQIFEAFTQDVDSDIYVYAHATAPFVSRETIRTEIEAVQKRGYDSAFCAERIQDYLWYNGKAVNFDPTNLPRGQDLPIYHRETSGVYVFTKAVFTEYRRRIGVKPYVVEVNRREAVDINTVEDFIFAEIMLNYGGSNVQI
jgi:CMP-N-acetylneuraminic acid synthetase